MQRVGRTGQDSRRSCDRAGGQGHCAHRVAECADVQRATCHGDRGGVAKQVTRTKEQGAEIQTNSTRGAQRVRNLDSTGVATRTHSNRLVVSRPGVCEIHGASGGCLQGGRVIGGGGAQRDSSRISRCATGVTATDRRVIGSGVRERTHVDRAGHREGSIH